MSADERALIQKITNDSELREMLWRALVADTGFIRALVEQINEGIEAGHIVIAGGNSEPR